MMWLAYLAAGVLCTGIAALVANNVRRILADPEAAVEQSSVWDGPLHHSIETPAQAKRTGYAKVLSVLLVGGLALFFYGFGIHLLVN